MIDKILPLIPEHILYCEPFFGGGSIFFAKEPSKIEIINDINDNLINFYRCIQENFEDLKYEINKTLHSRTMYKESLEIYNNPDKYNKIIRAWAFWYQCNMSFACGPGKGFGLAKEKQGGGGPHYVYWKKEKFTKIYTERLKSTTIENKNALDIIKNFDSILAFFYIDPPYFNSCCGHYSGYSEDDFVELLNILSNIKGKFLLSCYPSDVIYEFSKNINWKIKKFKNIKVAVNNVNKNNKLKTELLVYNYNIDEQQKLF
jgi:DNA adenine methylase